MPDLPRVWINDQALFDRAVAAFPGETNAQKAKSFRRWVRQQLKDYVIETETQAIVRANKNQVTAKRAEIEAIVFDPEDNPTPPPSPPMV